MAGTTTSSGLNNVLESTNQVQTTLPSWYDAAQQNVANQATTALGTAPSFGNTVAQGAVNTLQGPNDPFAQAQANLNTIGQGAVNPWNTDPTTGQVTPNTNTAMGGLFAAQQQQLNQLMPQYTAPVEAAGIASGNFGSLRGDTAVNKAMGDAQATLAAQQMQAALTNQQTGTQASAALGNVGAQGINAGLTTGAAQMNAPFQGATNYANLVNSINAPTTVSQQNQQSPLQMVSTLAGLPAVGTSLLNGIFGQASGTPGTSGYVPAGFLQTLQNAFSNTNSNTGNAGGYTDAQTQAAIDAQTAANMAPANPNPTAPDPSTLVTE